MGCISIASLATSLFTCLLASRGKSENRPLKNPYSPPPPQLPVPYQNTTSVLYSSHVCLFPVTMASELVYTAFCDNPQKQLAETMKQPPLDRDNSLRVRIVTPQDSFVLENGQPVPLSITLQQLRRIIAQRLDIPIDSIHEPKTQRGSCNCGLGRIIARYGLNDMILARHHKQKGFTSVYGDETQQECGICTESLFHPCPGCRNDPPPDQVDDCGIVRNIGCLHPFHHHCFVRAYYNSRSLRKECPYQPSCPLGYIHFFRPHS